MADFSHFQSQFGDTTLTKVFVGGLAWETQTEEMRSYFQQFGQILEAVIIKDKNTGKSKGYGFVTFRDPESAARACSNPNPIIGGRRANCNIASFGRHRQPSPSLLPSPGAGARNNAGNPQSIAPASGSYSGFRPPYPPPTPQFIYPPYGYQSYHPYYRAYQAIYNPQVQQPQVYHQPYRSSPPSPSSSSSSPSGYYSYSSRGGGFSIPHQTAQSLPAGIPPSYPYFANYTHIHQGSFYTPMQQHIITPTGSQSPQRTPTEIEGGVSASNSPNNSTS